MCFIEWTDCRRPASQRGPVQKVASEVSMPEASVRSDQVSSGFLVVRPSRPHLQGERYRLVPQGQRDCKRDGCCARSLPHCLVNEPT